MDNIHLFINAERGAAVVKRLAEAGHGISGVHVPPSRLDSPAITDACRAAGIQANGVEDVNAPSFVDELRQSGARLSIVGGFSTIFRQPLIDLPEFGTINLHAGRLPFYRGGSPLNWQIINGEHEAGVSVVRMDGDIDSGDVLAEGRIPIDDSDTIGDVHTKAHDLFPDLVLEVIANFEQGNFGGRAQLADESCYWHQRNDDDGRISWTDLSARQVFDLVRAITRPYPGASTVFEGQKLRIFAVSESDRVVKGVPGRIVWILGEGPYVVCRDRAVLLTDYGLEDGSRPKLKTGMRLG